MDRNRKAIMLELIDELRKDLAGSDMGRLRGEEPPIEAVEEKAVEDAVEDATLPPEQAEEIEESLEKEPEEESNFWRDLKRNRGSRG